MELFNIYNDFIMRSVPFIVNELIEKEQISKTQLSSIFLDSIDINDECTKLTEDYYVDGNIFDPHENKLPFLVKDGICFSLYDSDFLKSPLPIIFSKHEKEYIKLMLEDSESRCFMSEELIKKLEAALSDYDISYIKDNYLERGTTIREINENALRRTLPVISEALRKNKKIKYKYASLQKEDEYIASPYKLIYSLRERIFQLAVCPDSSPDSFMLMDVDRLINVELTDIDAEADYYKLYSSQRRKLILNVKNNKTKKSAERCMRTFSSYMRKTFYNNINDTFTMEVDFYLFDKESIIRDILSLGSDVQVIEVRKPGKKKGEFVKDDTLDIRGEIIAKLREMYSNMNDD